MPWALPDLSPAVARLHYSWTVDKKQIYRGVLFLFLGSQRATALQYHIVTGGLDRCQYFPTSLDFCAYTRVCFLLQTNTKMEPELLGFSMQEVASYVQQPASARASSQRVSPHIPR